MGPFAIASNNPFGDFVLPAFATLVPEGCTFLLEDTTSVPLNCMLQDTLESRFQGKQAGIRVIIQAGIIGPDQGDQGWFYTMVTGKNTGETQET